MNLNYSPNFFLSSALISAAALPLRLLLESEEIFDLAGEGRDFAARMKPEGWIVAPWARLLFRTLLSSETTTISDLGP